MRRSDIPCPKHCPLRTPTCHGTCKHYNEWAANHKKELEAEKQDDTWTASRGNAATRSIKYITKKDRGIL